ncbi:hypothetical protein G3I38_14280 [Streptomyces sp. SID7958]|uniref:Uncharacterized protein n=2 Tax=unclassified Streptomyces TaxID=2593676 RepID=A0A6G3R4C3_9ACTN|nr:MULTISPECIES: hypothetical protein [unclassified Streptomyces]NEA90422.1 hypothetical protein [Streptomyces sp. SID14436]NEC80370.1 hypothetical protein [Streptomyces sp. SID7958]
MSDGVAWIGAHHYTSDPLSTGGMLSGMSLTLARGVDQDEFLINLGADFDELAARTPLNELRRGPAPPAQPGARYSYAMYGTCGEWTYVLENDHMATWAGGCQGKVESMLPCEGEEVLCLTVNRFSPPAMIIHAPGDGRAYRAEFGTATACGTLLDVALAQAGAVFPSIPEASADEVVAYQEEHGERLPELVFTAVGVYTGVTIEQAVVAAGDLPSVHLLMP